jgi:uncharacterized membrane protein YccF (DUF307 family)
MFPKRRQTKRRSDKIANSSIGLPDKCGIFLGRTFVGPRNPGIQFGGLWMAVGWMVTIIGLPWTRAAFSIASYTLLPFGQKAVSRVEYTGLQDIGTGPLGILGNVLWLVLAGWWLALVLAITIVGIPFAWAPFEACGACALANR